MSRLTQRLLEVRLALSLLTRLPVGLLEPAPALPDSRWAYPLAGAAVAVVGWAVLGAGVFLGLSPILAGLCAMAAMVLATGGLHEDGLADYADGAGAGEDRDRRLEIMADSRIGSYGVLALILSIAIRAAALAAVGPAFWAFLAVEGFSRTMMLWAQENLAPARPDGLGAAARGAEGGWRTGAGLALGGLALVPLGGAGLAAGAAMVLAAMALARHAQARLGGQTGDVLGAVQQVAALAGWIVLAALAG